ncbi:MAG: GtrA family protein [Anaerolineaceae bacterium]|nr:GtrA family protein [Anaerolineaceae bacterium]
MILVNNKTERIRFIKFLVVGFISAAIDFGFMNLFTIVFNIPLVIAQALSFIIAVIESFILNRLWIYPSSRSKSLHKQFLQFLMVNLVGIAIRTSLISLFNNMIMSVLMKMKLSSAITQDQVLSHNLALASVVLIVLLWNFFANRFWTYSDVKIHPKQEDTAILKENLGSQDLSNSNPIQVSIDEEP